MDPITELRSDLRALQARAPQHPGLRRDFLFFGIKLDTLIGAAVEMAEDAPSGSYTTKEGDRVVTTIDSEGNVEGHLEEEDMPKGKGKETVRAVMHDFKEGTLHSGSKKGPVVTDPKQAQAIAISEAKQHPKKK